jgi:NitT/TauT family transport system substrate-binding protein
MSIKDKSVATTLQLTRRAFLKYASASTLLPTVLGMVPNLVSTRAYAQTEKKIPAEWLQIAAKYGKPTGKFGKIGDPVTLTIGYQPYCTGYWTASVNKQAKLWAKYLPKGSQVLWFRALSGPMINNNMTSGRNQFGYMAETPALRAGEMVKCDMVAVTGYDLGETGSICVPNGLLAEEKLRTAKNLETQRVGVPFGSYSHRQILTWAEQNQVKPELINQSIEQQMTYLKAEKIWAGALWEPYPQWLEQRGIASRWVTGREMPCTCAKYNPQAITHNFRMVGSTLAIHDWLRERPDIIMAYLKSEEAARALLTQKPDLAAYYVWADIAEIPPSVIRATLDMMVWDGRITTEVKQHLKGCARMWRKQQILTQPRTQDPDQYVDEWADDRYLQLAIQELQAQELWTSATLPGFPKEIRPDQLQRHSWKTYENIKLKPASGASN